MIKILNTLEISKVVGGNTSGNTSCNVHRCCPQVCIDEELGGGDRCASLTIPNYPVSECISLNEAIDSALSEICGENACSDAFRNVVNWFGLAITLQFCL